MNGDRDGEDKTATTTICITDSHLRLIGVLCSMLLITLSVFYIGVGLQYPSEQSIADSLYGYRTAHAIYEYFQDNEGTIVTTTATFIQTRRNTMI